MIFFILFNKIIGKNSEIHTNYNHRRKSIQFLPIKCKVVNLEMQHKGKDDVSEHMHEMGLTFSILTATLDIQNNILFYANFIKLYPQNIKYNGRNI